MRTCSFHGCQKPHDTRGLCHSHSEQRRLGKPLTPLRLVVPRYVCSVRGCKRPHCAKGFCRVHWAKRGQPKSACAACRLIRPVHGWGLCHRCYAKQRRTENPEAYRAIAKKQWARRRHKDNARRRELTPKRQAALLSKVEPCSTCRAPFRPYRMYQWRRWKTPRVYPASDRCSRCRRESHKAKNLASNRRGIRELRDWYVASAIRMRRAELPTSLLEAKREHLRLGRHLRNRTTPATNEAKRALLSIKRLIEDSQ